MPLLEDAAQELPRVPIQFHILSFEGPDGYSRAGGIATRICGLAQTLAAMDFDTHVWFIGDPMLPGHESHGRLHLHRWCQWISAFHPMGVYDGEEDKRGDYARSLPPFVMREVLREHLEGGGLGVVLAEEWHTADAVLHLDTLLHAEHLRDRAAIMWNANNTFGFDRIDWPHLKKAALICTVSRYMKHIMQPLAEAVVVPNGLGGDAFKSLPEDAVSEFRRRLIDRTVMTKMARWDPDKRWLMAIDILVELKRAGMKPLLIARGGVEAHGADVTAHAARAGLRVFERELNGGGVAGLLPALVDLDGADMVSIRSPVDSDARQLLFSASDAVLANSAHEPFGLVGLEVMAAGGLACTGCSGEDYAVPGHNALVLQTSDPREFLSMFREIKSSTGDEGAIREAGRSTALQFAWTSVTRRSLLPRVRMALNECTA